MDLIRYVKTIEEDGLRDYEVEKEDYTGEKECFGDSSTHVF